MRKKFWIIIILVILAVSGSVNFISLLNPVSQNPKTVIKTAELLAAGSQPKSDLFTGMLLKIPGAEANSYWELQVAKLENVADSGKMIAIKGNYFVKKRVIYKIIAQTGEVAWKSRILKFKGNVKLVSNDGKKLSAEDLQWDPNTKMILATRNVVLTFNKTNVKTDNLKADLALNKVVFIGLTTAMYQR